jgi:hypothetical protein
MEIKTPADLLSGKGLFPGSWNHLLCAHMVEEELSFIRVHFHEQRTSPTSWVRIKKYEFGEDKHSVHSTSYYLALFFFSWYLPI